MSGAQSSPTAATQAAELKSSVSPNNAASDVQKTKGSDTQINASKGKDLQKTESRDTPRDVKNGDIPNTAAKGKELQKTKSRDAESDVSRKKPIEEFDVVIETIEKGSSAEKAGLQAGMQVVTINGESVTNKTQYDQLLNKSGADVTVTLFVNEAATRRKVSEKYFLSCMPRFSKWNVLEEPHNNARIVGKQEHGVSVEVSAKDDSGEYRRLKDGSGWIKLRNGALGWSLEEFTRTVKMNGQKQLGVQMKQKDGRVGKFTVTIESVKKGSPADEIGLQEGMQFVAINGEAVRNKNEYDSLLQKYGPEVTVTVWTAAGVQRAGDRAEREARVKADAEAIAKRKVIEKYLLCCQPKYDHWNVLDKPLDKAKLVGKLAHGVVVEVCEKDESGEYRRLSDGSGWIQLRVGNFGWFLEEVTRTVKQTDKGQLGLKVKELPCTPKKDPKQDSKKNAGTPERDADAQLKKTGGYGVASQDLKSDAQRNADTELPFTSEVPANLPGSSSPKQLPQGGPSSTSGNEARLPLEASSKGPSSSSTLRPPQATNTGFSSSSPSVQQPPPQAYSKGSSSPNQLPQGGPPLTSGSEARLPPQASIKVPASSSTLRPPQATTGVSSSSSTQQPPQAYSKGAASSTSQQTPPQGSNSKGTESARPATKDGFVTAA